LHHFSILYIAWVESKLSPDCVDTRQGVQKLNRKVYLYSVSHCERILKFRFEKININTTSIWHPGSGKRLSCDTNLIEKYFGTGVPCELSYQAKYSNPYREVWHIVEHNLYIRDRSVYGELFSNLPLINEIFLSNELFEI
jgi:hypothetical protein